MPGALLLEDRVEFCPNTLWGNAKAGAAVVNGTIRNIVEEQPHQHTKCRKHLNRAERTLMQQLSHGVVGMSM
eukprot:COSAG02_NODE_2783_length_8036_cov_41.488976_4_plen_72_part_00